MDRQAGATCGDNNGSCPAGCTFYEDSDCAACNPEVGLTAPIRPCSSAWPCTRLLETYTSINALDTPTDIPVCKTQWPEAEQLPIGCVRGGRGIFDDSTTGSPLSWRDSDGSPRYWCEYRPVNTSAQFKRPLLIFFHGSGGSADDIYDFTLLRDKARNFDLSGDASRPGFVLIASQGRNLHWPTDHPEEGSKHDSYHRNLSTNQDVLFVDHLIDTLVQEGVIDPQRIYLTGWSNGARFAAFYGIARHPTATAGGNRVAAVAVYSGGDPFENISSDQVPSCKQDPYPTTELPYFLISRNCDAVACNQAQYDAFLGDNWIMTPGNQAESWLDALSSVMNDPNVQRMMIGYTGALRSECLEVGTSPLCNTLMALRNHLCWPDGIADGGGVDHENDLLTYFREHPLPSP